jgi:hypothetical protein
MLTRRLPRSSLEADFPTIRNDYAGMSDISPSPPDSDSGVLASLPSTRPQRSSARRAAARTAAKPGRGKQTRTAQTRPKQTQTAQTHPKQTQPARPTTTKRPEPSTQPANAKSAPKPPAKSARAGKRSRSAPRSAEAPVPRQGFEAENEIEPGSAVHPPSSTELAASLVELVAEVAQAGVSSGGRLLKDVLSRLPGV